MYLIDTRRYDDSFLLARILEKVDFSDEEKKKLFKHFEKPGVADAEPVRYGHWKTAKTDIGELLYCSECKVYGVWTKYCPNCGAKMDGDSNINSMR